MHTKYKVIVFMTCFLTSIFTSELQAVDTRSSPNVRQEANAESQYILGECDAGSLSWQMLCRSDCGFPKRICCSRRPTTLSYHPEVYNYRHYYNIVGHEAFFSSPFYQYHLPAVNLPEKILTPLPEDGTQSSQAAGSV